VLWEKLTRDFTKRGEISTLEQRAKRKDQEAIYRLEEICAVKLGKVGVVYNERKKKWYALITWTEHKPAPDANGQKAACNFGASNFLYVMAEDGVYYRDPGTDILALREQFDGQRSSVAQARRFFGSGAQGRGKKRRNLVSKKVGDKESRRVESRIRESASWLTRWCQRHNVKTLYIENLKGIRERFEQKTEGDAPENLKRLIHKWPYFETQEAIERSATKAGIKVVKKVAHLVTQRCPLCRHASPDNITEESHGGPVKLLRKTGPQNFIVDTSKGSPFRLVEKRRWFKCTKCAARGHLDAIACVNHLIDVGAEHAFNNMQEASRKRVKFTRSKIQKTMQPAAL
jgi:IS605 OrfB family transposase